MEFENSRVTIKSQVRQVNYLVCVLGNYEV